MSGTTATTTGRFDTGRGPRVARDSCCGAPPERGLELLQRGACAPSRSRRQQPTWCRSPAHGRDRRVLLSIVRAASELALGTGKRGLISRACTPLSLLLQGRRT
jgi:hypothetical protein